MANKMLIDAAHPEETRVVVLRGNRVEEFDFESASKKPLRGNIYLAKVTRVEPSLQAAFIEYGGNRHGFLAFSEIHPDYYQIPVADRQALLEEEARAHREDDEEQKHTNGRRSRRRRGSSPTSGKRADTGDESLSSEVVDAEGAAADGAEADAEIDGPQGGHEPSDEPGDGARDEPLLFSEETAPAAPAPEVSAAPAAEADTDIESAPSHDEPMHAVDESLPAESVGDEDAHEAIRDEDPPGAEPADAAPEARDDNGDDHESEDEIVEQIGGDASEDVPYRAPRLRRHYKIQEVIKRRQILLVQVVKEERGNKGAALTTYLSLAGRYSVLMPNTARGGGISRKITDSEDRKRLKAIAQQLDVPEGMGVILRTAGAARSDQEVRRDFEYLLRMWETVRELTLRSSAPMLVYEEGSLIKRAIRDLYSKEIDEICVAGDTGYREAKDYMRLLMPTHVKNVQLYRDTQPIFAKSGVEAQLDAMFSNHVTLRSGGYIVINQTEALVAIDVNSGRSTREHNIEDTALRTNLEAADEVARQLRLRDLAGLIVVDFIDMEEGRNNRSVERRIKDALKNDRARIQIGRISHFGLLEMSRQRIRTGVLEGSTVLCPHCAGAGTVRSTSSIALHILRVLEDTLIRSAAYNLVARTRTEVALYILNQKRPHLMDLEQRFGASISVLADATLTGAVYHAIERGEAATPVVMISSRQAGASDADAFDDDPALDGTADEDIADDENEESQAGATAGDGSDGGERKRKRRRRRRGRDRDPRGPGASFDGDEAKDAGENVAATNTDDDLDGLETPEREDAAFDVEALQPSETADAAGADEDQPAETLAEDDGEPKPEEASPRRRRSRRAAAKPIAAADEDRASVTENDDAPPRRSRRAKARPAEDAMPTLAFEGPSADRDVGADTAKNHPADEAEPAEAAAESVAPSVAPAPERDDVAQSPVMASPPAESEPPRPKRSGWWQRAKATITG